MENCVKDKDPVPDYDETRRRFKTGQTLNSKTTVAEWLDTWLTGRKLLVPATAEAGRFWSFSAPTTVGAF